MARPEGMVELSSRTEFIERIHATPTRVVLAVTGGGSRAISDLLVVPGASRTVISATVPYAAEAMTAWLGSTPEQFCAVETARMMAVAAFEQALVYTDDVIEGQRLPALAGIGATASLASDRPKRGVHRLHVGLQTAKRTATRSLELRKGARSRMEEEQLTSALILNLLADGCGLPDALELSLHGEEQVETEEVDAPEAWRDLWLGRVAAVRRREVVRPTAAERVVFPGAFNPLHDGHRQMARVAERMLGRAVEWEISIANVDKPTLDFVSMAGRLEQFDTDQVVWFTRAPRFTEKAELFSGATFVVGADTFVRLADPRYYGDDVRRRDEAIEQLRAANCRFLVFGRESASGFQTLGSLDLPDALERLAIEVPESEFRADVSSTEIRTAQTAE